MLYLLRAADDEDDDWVPWPSRRNRWHGYTECFCGSNVRHVVVHHRVQPCCSCPYAEKELAPAKGRYPILWTCRAMSVDRSSALSNNCRRTDAWTCLCGSDASFFINQCTRWSINHLLHNFLELYVYEFCCDTSILVSPSTKTQTMDNVTRCSALKTTNDSHGFPAAYNL